MEMGEFIDIIKKDGSKEKMELLMDFRLEDSKKDCIFYRSAVNNKVYVAAYDKNNEKIILNHKFTDEEKSKLQEIYKKLFAGGNENA